MNPRSKSTSVHFSLNSSPRLMPVNKAMRMMFAASISVDSDMAFRRLFNWFGVKSSVVQLSTFTVSIGKGSSRQSCLFAPKWMIRFSSPRTCLHGLGFQLFGKVDAQPVDVKADDLMGFLIPQGRLYVFLETALVGLILRVRPLDSLWPCLLFDVFIPKTGEGPFSGLFKLRRLFCLALFFSGFAPPLDPIRPDPCSLRRLSCHRHTDGLLFLHKLSLFLENDIENTFLSLAADPYRFTVKDARIFCLDSFHNSPYNTATSWKNRQLELVQ